MHNALYAAAHARAHMPCSLVAHPPLFCTLNCVLSPDDTQPTKPRRAARQANHARSAPARKILLPPVAVNQPCRAAHLPGSC